MINNLNNLLGHYAHILGGNLNQTTLQCAIMDAIASQMTRLTIVFSTVYLDTDKRKHQSSASLAFVRGIHRRPVNSPHKWPVTRKMFPFDDVIMKSNSELIKGPPNCTCMTDFKKI